MNDLISRQAAIDAIQKLSIPEDMCVFEIMSHVEVEIATLPSAQPERLTDDDFETIRIHLNAYKENLCNQYRWKEAEKYQRIIDRFMAFASALGGRNEMRLVDADALITDIKECIEVKDAYCEYEQIEGLEVALSCIDEAPTVQLERKTGEWLLHTYMPHNNYCSCCEKDSPYNKRWAFCPNCGAYMRGEQDE